MTLPADLKAGEKNCKVTLTASSDIFEIGKLASEAASGEVELKVTIKEKSELLAGDYDLTVEVEMLDDATDGAYTKGAHRKLSTSFTVENNDFAVSVKSGDGDTGTNFAVTGEDYDGILIFKRPESPAADAAMPSVTVFSVGQDLERETDYKIEGLSIAEFDTTTKDTLKAKKDQLGKEEIVTISGKYYNDYKLKIVTQAYVKKGDLPLLEEAGSTQTLDHYIPSASATAFEFKWTAGKSDFAGYDTVKTATLASDGVKTKDLTQQVEGAEANGTKYYDADLKTFTIPAAEMKALTKDIKITVVLQKGETPSDANDTYTLEKTVAALPADRTQPNFEHANATYYYVLGTEANQELEIVDRVANMKLELYKDNTNGDPLVEEGKPNAVYSYDLETGKLVIYGSYLETALAASATKFDLIAKFTYGDNKKPASGNDTRKTSTVTFVRATTAPVFTGEGEVVDFANKKGPADVEYGVTKDSGFGNITKLEAYFYVPATSDTPPVAEKEIAKVEVPRESWTFDRSGTTKKLTISHEWFNSLKSATYYKDVIGAPTSVVKFNATFKALSTDGDLTVETPNASITKPATAGDADFTFIPGNGVFTYKVAPVKPEDPPAIKYYAILEVDSQLKKDSKTEYEPVPVPLDLEKAFDGANGTKLYAVPGLGLQLPNDNTLTGGVNSTIIAAAAATPTSKAISDAKTVKMTAPGYGDGVSIDVFVINKELSRQTNIAATKLIGENIKDLPEGVEVNGDVTIKRTGSLASGSFDLAKMFKGVELPPFIQGKADFDTFTVGVKYFNEIPLTGKTELDDTQKKNLEEDKKNVSLSGTTVTAETDGKSVKFVVSFTDSKSGLVYGTQEVTVISKVVGQSSDTIKTELYTGKQDSTATPDPADDATRLKAHAAAGLSFSGNTIHFNEEQLRLAIASSSTDLAPLVNDGAYAATLWVTTNADVGENGEIYYAISKSLAEAQGVTPGTKYGKGFQQKVNFFVKDSKGNFKKAEDQKFYITWLKDSKSVGAKPETSITEVKVSIDMDKTQSIVGTSAWEVFTPSNATASYAESGLTVAGDQLVYNAQAATAKTKLNKITLMVKAPANTTAAQLDKDYDGEYKKTITGVSYDKTLGALVAEISFPADTVQGALNDLSDTYIRWTIETTGENNAKTISYAYTKAVNPYSYSTINQVVYEDIALSEKSSTITLDGMKSLPKDALYAGATAEVKLVTAAAYQGIDGKATTLPTTVKDLTMIDWSYEFVSSGKNETYAENNPKGVSVAFGNASTEAGKGQTMRVTVDKGITKGGTLTITGKFHNNSLIGSVEKKLVLKIAPLHYVEDVKFAVNSAQVMLTAGKSVTYAPKLVVGPSAKASFDKLELTVAGINGTEAKATVDDKNKVIFTAPGQYELTATYKAKKLGQTTEDVLASDKMVVTVVDKTNAYKSLALADPKGSKVVDVVKTNDVAAMTVDVPMLTGKDASGAVVNIDPKADEYKSAITYLVAPGKNSVAEINIVDGVITANVANGGATAKVTAFYMGKSVPFTVNFYTTDKDDKAVLALYDSTGVKIDNKNLPKAGEVYSYKLETSGKTPADIAYFESALEIAGDGKNLVATETYKLNTENKTIQFLAPVSGKLNFTLKGDPKNRKGSLAVNMTKTAEAPTSIYFDEKNIEAGAGALFDGSTFYRVGTDDATITINPVLTPSWAYDQFTWTVSDSKVATIKANKDGSATLTWKKINGNEPLLVTATTKSKNAKTSYTMSMWVSDSVPSIVGNPKTVFINTADSSVGTTLALDYGYTKFANDSTFTAQVVTYDKKKGEYIDAPAYTADISADGKAVTLRASSTAKAGKYYLKLMGIVTAEGGKVTENGPYYLPLTVKLGKVTDASKISVTGKVAAVNNAVYGNLSLITLTGKNVDPSAVLLEMSKDVDGLALVKVDGLWYIKYTGTPVADKVKTNPQTIELKYSIPGVALTNDKLSLKVTFKAALADYNFTTKAEKLFTLGLTNTKQEVYVELINKSGVFNNAEVYDYIRNNPDSAISFSQGRGKGAYLADYLKVSKFYKGENGKFYLVLASKTETVDGKTVHVDLPSGNLTADVTLTFKGGATATAPITVNVNTDGSNKTVKLSKATITGSMPIIAPGSDEGKELEERGAYLTLTRPATIEDKEIIDVKITSPDGFVVEEDNNGALRVGYKGTLAEYQAIKSKLTVEAAFDGYIKPKEGSNQVKATTIASIQIAKPAAAFDKAVPFTTQYKVVKAGEEDKWISVGRNAAGEYELPDMKLGDPALTLRVLNEQNDEDNPIETLTYVSSDPKVVKTNSFTNGTLYAQGAGNTTITISGTGYITQTINVTVNADELALKDPAKADGKNQYKITQDFNVGGNEIGITDLLPGGAEEAAKVTVLIDAKDQSIVSYSSGIFTIHKGTPGVTATIRKTNYADVKLTFVINEIDPKAEVVSTINTVVSGDVKTGFVLTGLTKDTKTTDAQIKFTEPASGIVVTPVGDAKKYVTCAAEKDQDDKLTGVFTFTWVKDASADVVYTFKADGYKAVTVTIKPAKLPAKELLAQYDTTVFKNAGYDFNGTTATWNLKKGTATDELSFKADEGNTVVTVTSADANKVKVEAGTTDPTKYKITPLDVTDGTDLTLKAEGYEDAKIKVIVSENPAALTKMKYKIGTGAIADDNGTVVAALTGVTSEGKTIGFYTRPAEGNPEPMKVAITPVGNAADYVECTESTNKEWTFKAIKGTPADKPATFKASANGYATMTFTVATDTPSAGALLQFLKEDKANGFKLTKDSTGTVTAAALELYAGKDVSINFSDKVDITATLTGQNVTMTNVGNLYTFKPTAKSASGITLKLEADGYTAETINVTIRSLEEFLEADTTAGIALSTDTLGLAMIADGIEKTSGKAILKEISGSPNVEIPANIKATLEAGTGLSTDKISDYVELKELKNNMLTMTAKKEEATGQKVVLRLSQSTWGHIDIPIKITKAGNSAAIAAGDGITGTAGVVFDADEKTLKVPVSAKAEEYQFTIKDDSTSNAITGLKLDKTKVKGADITAALGADGTVTVTVPANATDSETKLLFTAPDYNFVEMTVTTHNAARLNMEGISELTYSEATGKYTLTELVGGKAAVSIPWVGTVDVSGMACEANDYVEFSPLAAGLKLQVKGSQDADKNTKLTFKKTGYTDLVINVTVKYSQMSVTKGGTTVTVTDDKFAINSSSDLGDYTFAGGSGFTLGDISVTPVASPTKISAVKKDGVNVVTFAEVTENDFPAASAKETFKVTAEGFKPVSVEVGAAS